MEKKKLVIVAAGGNAAIAFHNINESGGIEIAGFAVEREWLTIRERFGKPIVALEEIERHFPPESHDALVAINFSGLNRNRERMFNTVKDKGYKCINYVSPHAVLGPQVKLGENVVILENSNIQFGCEIGDNTMIWNGVVILHESVIGSHVAIGSNVAIAGSCKVGDYSVFGIGSVTLEQLEIGRDCTIGAGAVVTRNLPDNTYIRPQKMFVQEDGSRQLWEGK